MSVVGSAFQQENGRGKFKIKILWKRMYKCFILCTREIMSHLKIRPVSLDENVENDKLSKVDFVVHYLILNSLKNVFVRPWPDS